MKLNSDQKRMLGRVGKQFTELCVTALAAARITETMLPITNPAVVKRIDARHLAMVEKEADAIGRVLFVTETIVPVFIAQLRVSLDALKTTLAAGSEQQSSEEESGRVMHHKPYRMGDHPGIARGIHLDEFRANFERAAFDDPNDLTLA